MAEIGLSSAKTSEIELSGELCIRDINEAHTRLIDALHAEPALVAVIDEDAAVDLSFIQLLESARRTARETGAAFSLARPAAGELLEVLQRGGFVQSHSDRAFWLNESEGS